MINMWGVVYQLTVSCSQGTPTHTYVHSVIRFLRSKRKLKMNRIQVRRGQNMPLSLAMLEKSLSSYIIVVKF